MNTALVTKNLLLKLEYPENKTEVSINRSDDLPIYSFFTGAGFLDFGFEAAGFKTCLVNECHSPFVDGYLYGSHKLKKSRDPIIHNCSIVDFLSNDARLPVLKSSVPVGFIGGPPCPDFSVAGKQKGSNGDNGKLTGSYAELICQKLPDWFLLENVKGLWRTKKHRAFYDEICSKFLAAGYCLTNRLINSIEYGVPQDRERIILLGFRCELIGESSGRWLNEGEFPWKYALKFDAQNILRRPWPAQTPFGGDPLLPVGCPKKLTVEHWFQKNDVENHPNSAHCFVPRAALAKFQSIAEGDDLKKSCKRLHRWRYSPTAAYGNNEVHLHPYKARRISAAEALSLQSLPKGFELPSTMSLSNMFKTIGNGVPYLAAKGLALSVKRFLLERAL